METTTLKSFATKARTDLIKEVGARVSVVLEENSLARVESLAAVRHLEEAIVRDGRDQVIDRVAYTWFNRIIALRFMDANGYTPSAIVSPEAGRTTGQPEVLAEAKAGSFDSSVVPEKTQETITALFNRTRPSQDPDGEAYGLLLEAYCRSWHKAMPFMFEREGDYTELLIPAALLAVDSVRDRAVRTLTEEVCRDVEVIGWLYQFYISERKDEVFDGFKKNKKAGAAEIPAATQLFTPHWIVRYLVENSLGRLWLLNNPTSRLAEQMDYYIKPVDEETDFLKIARPEELKIIDPAVGSGHMLTYAFDLLYAIYTEKSYDPADIPGLILQHNLYGTEIDPRAGALAAFALTMKAAARRKLFLKNPVQPNVCVLENVTFDPEEMDYLWSLTKAGSFDRSDVDEFWNTFEYADTFGSLIQPKQHLAAPLRVAIENVDSSGDLLHARTLEKASVVVKQADYLSQRYGVVVANPPYMGSKNMSSGLAEWLSHFFPRAKYDLMTAFMERSPRFVTPLGMWGMINIPTWMFQTSFEAFRGNLLASSTLESLLHLGRGVFGADFGSTAFVIKAAPPSGYRTVFRRLFKEHVEVRPNSVIEQLFLGGSFGYFTADQRALGSIPGAPIAYWLSAAVLDVFRSRPQLGSVAVPRQGLITADDKRFLRFWYEVSAARMSQQAAGREAARASGCRWFPYNKGGAYRRWFGNLEYVVDWEDDGHAIRGFVDDAGKVRSRPQNLDYYFREGVTWSNISSGAPSFRFAPEGTVFSSVGQTIFGTHLENLRWLGLLNSEPVTNLLRILAAGIHFNAGEIARIPLPEVNWEATETRSELLIGLARADWDMQETSLGYATNVLIEREMPSSLLADTVQRAIDGLQERLRRIAELEKENDLEFWGGYGLEASDFGVSEEATPRFSTVPSKLVGTLIGELVSYAVGCMFGRYSLDEPGLMLADQGSTLQDYLAKVPDPSFMPDQDNVIPIVDGDWFEDDIVTRFRKFLRVAFGEEYFEENLQFVTESLGVRDIRDYFVKSFYDGHVQRYKKRPIYWLFRSPKGSFSALIYLHRYTPSTASTVLTGYLREFIGKLEANLEHQVRVAAGMGGASPREVAAALKEADRIRKVLVELRDYEHDVLFPLAGQQIALDLDDGVLVNYQKLGPALKDIGLKKGGGGE